MQNLLKQKKSISKSVRLSESVYHYIDAFDGDGFNEKFENIIYFSMQMEADLKKRIANLNQDIADLEQKEKDLNLAITSAVNQISDEFDNMSKVFQSRLLSIRSDFLGIQRHF
ncbi:MAG: hypothetical protein PHG16_07075 [Lachnospiraceae bacterium]|nr:hypothetical protein [Lachnospiraceae bacterium]